MFYILDETGKLVRTATTVPDESAVKAAGYTTVESDLETDVDSIVFHGFPDRTVAIARQIAQRPRIVLTTSAEDLDGDGVAELVADGTTKATIRIFLRDAKGLVKKSAAVLLQTSAGSLSQRRVITKAGKAAVQFVAGNETVNAVIHASADGFDPGIVQFELLPAEPQGKKTEVIR